MAVKRYNGSSWDTVAGLGAQGAAATSSSITTWVKTATGGETSLTGSSDSSTTLAYTPGQEQFFINGVLQARGSDYTATNGTSITGITALVAGDIATVTTVNAFSVAGAVPLSTVTANGDLIVGTSSGAVGRLGIGSTGNLLTVSGGVPVWAAPAGGAKSFAQLGTASLSSTITTISGLSGYDDFLVIINTATIASGAGDLRWRFNGNTGSVYTQAGSSFVGAASYTPGISGSTGRFASTACDVGKSNSTTGGWVNASLSIRGGNSSGLKVLAGNSGNVDNGGNGSENRNWQGFFNDTNVISSISILTLSSTFSAGTITVYGAV